MASDTLDVHGLTVLDACKAVEQHIVRARSGDRLRIIHGYGSSGSGGVLRTAVRNHLKFWRSQGLLEIDPMQDYRNPGATCVLFF